MSLLTSTPKPQSPNDEDKRKARSPLTKVTSTANWKMEGLKSLEMPNLEVGGETAMHSWPLAFGT